MEKFIVKSPGLYQPLQTSILQMTGLLWEQTAIPKLVKNLFKVIEIIHRKATPQPINNTINPSLAEHGMPCLSKQCRSKSAGF